MYSKFEVFKFLLRPACICVGDTNTSKICKNCSTVLIQLNCERNHHYTKKALTLKYKINHPQNYLDKNCVVFHYITAFYKSNETNDTYLIILH